MAVENRRTDVLQTDFNLEVHIITFSVISLIRSLKSNILAIKLHKTFSKFCLQIHNPL